MPTNITNGLASLGLSDDRIALGDVTHNNIKQLQLLIKTVRPIDRDEAWWKRSVESCEDAKEGYEPIKLGIVRKKG